MKYYILINQKAIVENNLNKDLDITDFIILDYILGFYFYQGDGVKYAQVEGERYIWINYQHLLREMPLLKIKQTESLRLRIKKLKQAGLIKIFPYKTSKGTEIYIKPTDKISALIFDKTHPNQTLTHPNEDWVGHPNQNWGKHNINRTIINLKKINDPSKKKGKKKSSNKNKRKNFRVKPEVYKRIISAYMKARGIQLKGADFGPVKQAIKTILYSGYQEEDVLHMIQWLSWIKEGLEVGEKDFEKRYSWLRNWTILTIKRKLPEFLAGNLFFYDYPFEIELAKKMNLLKEEHDNTNLK